jgi:hypothetical protein
MKALEADRAIAEAARAEGCRFCEGPLHRGDYKREPRGVPLELESEESCKRFSFCCGDCRKRTTPPSMRFLGRRVYLGAVVVLVAAARSGLTPERLGRLRRLFRAELSRRTIARWVAWWRGAFATSGFWMQVRGQLLRPVAAGTIPEGLLAAFTGEARERVLSLLRFLGPITSSTARGSMAF